MQYTIKNREISVTVESFGAEIVSVVRRGEERIWQNPTGDWSGHAPILFPVCGCCQLWLDGKQYPLKKHGFGLHMPYALAEAGEDYVVLSLSDNEETYQMYPFRFTLYVRYILEGATVKCDLSVQNTGDTPLYYFTGGHECNALPKTLEHYRLVFEKEELFHSYGDDNGILNDKVTPYGKGRILPMPTSGLQNRETVKFININSRKVVLEEKDGTPVAAFVFPGYSHLFLWSPDGKNAICVEPWINLPDTQANAETDFRQKDNVICVAPGEIHTSKREVTFF